MSVMRVGIMRMGMPERLVPVPVRMWFAGRITGPVLMPVMLYTGLKGHRSIHLSLAVVFGVLWTGTFVTGVFFLPH